MDKMQITPLLIAATCWLTAAPAFAAPIFKAQVYREEGPDGVCLTMIGNVAWSDKDGTPYRNQPVVSLRINNAELSKDDFEEIAAFHTLQELELGIGPEGVVLKDWDLSPLKSLKKLKSVAFCIANPAGLRLDFLPLLPKLEELAIWPHDKGKFMLDKTAAEMIGNLAGLQSLKIAFPDKLDDEAVYLVLRSRQLKALELASSEMTDASLKFIAANQGLTTLELIAPHLTDDVGEMAARLQKLTSLSISSSQTSAHVLKGIAKLRDLKSLSLRIPNASPGDFALLRAMTRLELLRLNNCLVTEEEIRELAGHPNLKYLYLPGADASPAARDIITNLPRIDHAELGSWRFTKGK